ncbi:type II toxin-antitoxin system prevent-host-death family antitoxin [Mycobacterium sp.]|uniref:type II toxin-antitoxin system prevent-host-death family antitoxin n=1 Tax=Mycobacterium sp. TaxID=1785 RepID=UPI003D6A39D7
MATIPRKELRNNVGEVLRRAKAGEEITITVASIAELHFGVLVARDDDERAIRTERLGAIESTFDPFPITVEVAREWGRLSATASNRGGRPRCRSIDLVIAAPQTLTGYLFSPT